MSGAELAGSLREQVTILRRAPGRDAIGGANGDWIALGTRPAAVIPARPGATVQGDTLAGVPRWLVTMRNEGALPEPGDRIAWRDRRLMVRFAEADPRRPDRVVAGTEEER